MHRYEHMSTFNSSLPLTHSDLPDIRDMRNAEELGQQLFFLAGLKKRPKKLSRIHDKLEDVMSRVG